MNFEQAFELLVGHEGGYVNDPRDPGGETKYGISKRSYPNLDIARLTLAEAKDIYLRDFWDRAKMDSLPEKARFDIFDTAVNSGIGTAIRLAQKAVGVAEDGYMGPITIKAINEFSGSAFVSLFNSERLLFWTSLSNWRDHGKGWARRAASNLRRLGSTSS